jgi:hypothetical protein
MMRIAWRVPDASLTLQWRGPDARIIAAAFHNTQTQVATIIGPPGNAGQAGPAGPAGPAYDLNTAVIDAGTFA